MKAQNTNLSKQVISLVILLIAFLLPRAFSLGRFVAVDEVNWLHRSANFYDAVVRKSWSETYVNNSPGVITTWVGSLAFRVAAPNYRVTRDLMRTSYTAFQNDLTKQHNVQPLFVLAISRVIMILLLIAVLVICYFYAQRLFGLLPSLIGFLMIALDPFFIALTRMAHLDAPQAVFMFLSILAFLNYLLRGRRWFDLIVSGMAGGISLLSKLPGIFIIPTIGLVTIWDYLISRSRNKLSLSTLADQSFRKMIQSLLIWSLAFLIAYAVVWPSMWVQPIKTIQRVSNVTSKYAGTIVDEKPPEQDIDTNSEPARSFADYIRYPRSFLWRTTPVVLLGIILLLYVYLYKKDEVLDESARRTIQGLLIFTLIYTVGLTLPTNTSEKYYAPVYLLLDLFAGLGWFYSVLLLSNRFHLKKRSYLHYIILLAVILTQSIWVVRSYPYYFSHYNPLLGGLNRAANVKFIGVGEGLDIAGQYLMKKPKRTDLGVMSWYGVGPLSYFFDGKVVPLYMSNSNWTPEFVERLREMDYLVIYTNQKFRNQPPELFDMLKEIPPEYTVRINGAEYAWIYDVKDLPLPAAE